MAVWRRKALALFPRHAKEIENPESSIHRLFFELLADLEAAHATGDRKEAARIHSFAAWSFEQRDLRDAAGVAFYEHLFDPEMWMHRADVAKAVPPSVAAEVWSLWAARLTPERLAEVGRLTGLPSDAARRSALRRWLPRRRGG